MSYTHAEVRLKPEGSDWPFLTLLFGGSAGIMITYAASLVFAHRLWEHWWALILVFTAFLVGIHWFLVHERKNTTILAVAYAIVAGSALVVTSFATEDWVTWLVMLVFSFFANLGLLILALAIYVLTDHSVPVDDC